MAKYTKNNKTSKKTIKGGFPAKPIISPGTTKKGNKKTRRNRRKRQNKSIRSIYNSKSI